MPRISTHIFILAACTLVSAGILLHFYNMFWYAPDDGVFMHNADLLSKGGVYGVTVHGIHPGYHALLNTLLFKLFGADFVVLRYPLVVLCTLQAAMICHMLRGRGALVSFMAGVTSTAIGFVQYLSASPNWYALFFAVLCVFLLTECRDKKWVWPLLGAIVGVTFLFRHPSGIFLGAGIAVYAISQSGAVTSRMAKVAGMALSSAILIGLLAYNALIGDIAVSVQIGLWPVVMLMLLLMRGAAIDAAAFRKLLLAAAGGAAALMPMLMYQIVWGDILAWFQSSFMTSSSILDRAFFAERRYWNLPAVCLGILWKQRDILALAVTGYWILLYILPIVAGIRGVAAILNKAPHPALCIAPFFAYVSIYYQIPFYFFTSAGLMLLAALVPGEKDAPPALAYGQAAAMALVCGFALFLYAASPIHLGAKNDTPAGIPGVSLIIPKKSQETYEHLLALIERHSRKDDYIFAFPVNPEIYFLSQRKNPLKYCCTPFEITSDEKLEEAKKQLLANKPKIVIYRAVTIYRGPYEEALAAWLTERAGYRRIETIDDIDKGEYEILIP